MRAISKVPQALICKGDGKDFDEQKHKRAGDGKFTSGSGGGGGAKSKDKKKDKIAPSSSQAEKKAKKEAGRKLRGADAVEEVLGEEALHQAKIDMDVEDLLGEEALERAKADMDAEEESVSKLLEGLTSEGAMSDEEFDQFNSKIEAEKANQGKPKTDALASLKERNKAGFDQLERKISSDRLRADIDNLLARLTSKSPVPPVVKQKKAKSFLGAIGSAVTKAAGGAAWGFGWAEHAAADFVNKTIPDNLNKLTGTKGKIARGVWKATVMGTKAAFSAYTTGMAIAEQAALDSGATPTQARRIRNICVGLDMAGAKIVPLACKAVGLGGLGLAASFAVPMGSALYVAYSGVRRPVKTFKAAVKAVGKLIKGEAINPEADAAAEHEPHGEPGHGAQHKRFDLALKKFDELVGKSARGDDPSSEGDPRTESKKLLRVYHEASVRAGNPDRFDVLVRAAVSLTQDFRKALVVAIRAEADYKRKDRAKKRSAVA